MVKVCKVLVIEDNPLIQDLLGDMFADEGYHFTIAASGAEMRRILAEDADIDVVVIDLLLPGNADGLTLAEEVALRGLGVVLVTGDHSRAETLNASGHRYLLKPFQLEQLLTTVSEVLDSTRRHCETINRHPVDATP
jgi:DNA-binding response OmpR family regulator